MATLDDKYAYTDGFGRAVREASSRHGQGGADTLTQAAAQFNSLFRNLVGRDPTPDEANTFYDAQLARRPWEYGDAGSQEYRALRDTATSFITDNFQDAIQKDVELQLKNQQAEATRLADLFRTQGNQAISGVEESLLGYQQKLFERLRPQLLTSLQAQGLLDTGGLNMALAGQQGDLAREGAKQIADLKFQNEQAANQIAFGGASAPYQFQQGMAMNKVPWMQQQAQGSLQNLFQQRIMDQQSANQMALLNRQAQIQRESQPSFLRTLGQNFAQNFGGQLGTGSANALGSSILGPSFNSGNQNQMALLKALGMGA